MIVMLGVTILVLLIIGLLLQRRPANYPPGPFPWPFIGNIFYLSKLSKKFGGQHIAFIELCKQYGSDVIALKLGGGNVIVVCDNKLIHEVLNREEYDGRPWNEFVKLRNMGMKKGITMNDGEGWREIRNYSVRTLKTIGFAKREMSEMIINELIVILKKLRNDGVQYLRPIVMPAVLNVLWILLTGKTASEDFKLQSFMNLLHRRSQAFDMAGGLLSSFPWLRYVAPNISGYNTLIKVNEELKECIKGTINEHKRRYVEGSETDFIDMFIREMSTRQTESEPFTDDDLFLTLVDFFIAGSSTTTSTLDFLFLNMVNHQDVQRKLHEEIDAVIGNERLPDLSDRPNMPFTEAVLNESQRLCIVTPLVGPRRVLADTTLGGYVIPKDTVVLLNIFMNNTDPKMYPDSMSFKPERFFKDGTYQVDENVLLFGKGKRRCPGEALAKRAIWLLFVGVMQNYRLQPVPGKERVDVEVDSGLSISAKPYEILIVPRCSDSHRQASNHA